MCFVLDRVALAIGCACVWSGALAAFHPPIWLCLLFRSAKVFRLRQPRGKLQALGLTSHPVAIERQEAGKQNREKDVQAIVYHLDRTASTGISPEQNMR